MELSRGVVYLLTGAKHACRLVVSINSLRRFYRGPVMLMTPSPSRVIEQAIAFDSDLDVHLCEIPRVSKRRNSTYLCKTTLWRHSPFDRTLLVDADTLFVADPFDDIWPNEDEVVLTRFSNWVSNRRPIEKRLRRWQSIVPELHAAAIAEPWPAVNTGVISWHKSARSFLEQWESITARRRSFICDELVAQLLYPSVKHRVLDDRFNFSPVYGHADGDVRIWHFHGSKHLRRRSDVVWVPEFVFCATQDVGGLKSWGPAGDATLEAYATSAEPLAPAVRAALAIIETSRAGERQNRSEGPSRA